MSHEKRVDKHFCLLCIGAKWLREEKENPSLQFFNGWRHIHAGPVFHYSERPDIFEFNGIATLCIEVKLSKASFYNDKTKKCMQPTYQNKMGMYRCYLAPKGILTHKSIPEGWGLLEWNEHDNSIEVTIPCSKKWNPTEGGHLCYW